MEVQEARDEDDMSSGFSHFAKEHVSPSYLPIYEEIKDKLFETVPDTPTPSSEDQEIELSLIHISEPTRPY
eukprot:462112-Hanusia_phi.AAC.1